MPFSSLTSLSPLDGRYAGKLDALRPEFSEYGLIRRRLQIEIEWLKTLAAEPHFAEIPAFSPATLAEVDALLAEFSPLYAAEVKAIEAVTNHDVKALEYWIRKRLAANAEVMRVAEFIHFACTSEDINNLAHALMLQAARDGTATREELSGSTITITSLGPIGGVVTTPVINHPEVAIIGPNAIVDRPVVRNGVIVVRKMMNLSSSFDHRVVDGYDAALFIQRVKALLEHPALMFM